ncbi:hypothetical protein BCV44_21955 [Vibrio cyclitrophicus]|uniref:hypothetical protein n=1 Tax=Vibrio cyclitrophicus TaxID=47951 RepID=UPI000C82CA5A|nr:hypothetical protein [Vibrio cyclitrophicus]PME09973.1 hypothetical protein BCV44_21955 [Vibrio cyclitrophicus]
MELDQFVAKSLMMICKGVHQAQQEVAQFGASINETPIPGGVSSNHLKAQNRTLMQTVDFDVAVTTEDNDSGSAKISVLGFGLNKSGDTTDTISSRISFKVPISLPNTPK